MTAPADPLTIKETQRLEELEFVIRAGWKTFLQVGEALNEIKESRLYRKTHPSFEEYCQDIWGWTRQRAYALIRSISTAEVMATVGVTVENERQARALRPVAIEVARTPVPQRTPQTLQQAREVVQTRADTRARVETTIRAALPPAAPKKVEFVFRLEGGRWKGAVFIAQQPQHIEAATLPELMEKIQAALPQEART